MKNKEELFAEYLQSEPEKKGELRRQLEKEGIDYLELEKLNTMINQLPRPKVSSELDETFYNMLRRKKKKSQSSGIFQVQPLHVLFNFFKNPVAIRVAYSLLLIAFGWFMGHRVTMEQTDNLRLTSMTEEISEMKRMMIFTMLNQESPVQRIKAIHYVRTLSHVDDEVIETLLNTLNTDPNVNVRLVSLETLTGFSGHSIVKKALIHSVNSQNSPLLQLELVNVLTLSPDEESISSLQQLLGKKDLNYSVRAQIEKKLSTLI